MGCLSRVPRRVARTVLRGRRRSNASALPDNKIHWVRDVTFREDASQVNTASRPRIMATLRNLVIGLIRQAGYTTIASTIRKIRNNPHLLLTILGPRTHPHNTS